MENPSFIAKLEKSEDMDAFKAAFAAEGIDYDAEFAVDEEEATDVELSADELDIVAGGRMSAGEVTRMVIKALGNGCKIVKRGPTAWFKLAGSMTVLSKAYYDALVHNNVFRTFNQLEIEDAMKMVNRS